MKNKVVVIDFDRSGTRSEIYAQSLEILLNDGWKIKSTQVCIVGGGGYGGHGGNVPVTNAFVGGGNGGNSGSTRVVNITPEIGKKYNVFVPGTGGSYKYEFKGMLKENPQTLFDIYTM